MNEWSRNFLLICFEALLGLLLVQGCSPIARHQVLTFFFDGVPPLEGEKQVPAPTAKEVRPRAPEETAGPAIPEKPEHKIYKHPPYAMKMCDSCHNVGNNTIGAPMGFSLVEERTKLCVMCHDDKSQEELGKTYKWVHGPVQYGACLECHHPHESTQPYMIRVAPMQKLCLGCHNRERLFSTTIHADIGDTDCTECHDPHGSRTRYMLKM